MVEQLTGHMPPDADIETILADPGGACPDCVRIVIEGFRAEVERLRERERYLQETADAAVNGWKKADRRAAHHEDRAENLSRQLRAALAERQQAETEADVSDGAAAAWRTVYEQAAAQAKRLRKELDQVRAERDAARVGMEKLRDLHRGVCVGACGLDDACECEERALACGECAASWPCATIRALDGTEAGQW